MQEIQTHFTPLIKDHYKNFLIESQYEEEREYPDSEDQIHEILIRDHYLSQKDIKVCLNFNIATLRKEDGFDQIEFLYKFLCEDYGTGEENE